jgi:PIN domain nuclease of toxin-antitoxin system
MSLLLDTHVLIWWIEAPSRIPARLHDMITDAATRVFVSAATAWEITTKHRLGKLSFEQAFIDDFDNRLRDSSFEPLPISARHAIAGASLAGRHKDPFDRLLVGQALCEGLSIVSADRLIATLGAKIVW